MFKKFSMQVLREMELGETRIFCPTSKGDGGQVHLAAKRAGGLIKAQKAMLVIGKELNTIEGYSVTLVRELQPPKQRGPKAKEATH